MSNLERFQESFDDQAKGANEGRLAGFPFSLFGLEPLRAAYGRKYPSLEAAQRDFDENKDFQAVNGQYTSKRELLRFRLTQIRVRYGSGKSGCLNF